MTSTPGEDPQQPQQPPPPPPPPYGQPGYGAPPPYGYLQPPDHPRATTAMILGIVSLVCCQLTGPFAWVIGGRAVREIDASGGRLGGRGQAMAGKVLGIIGTVLLVLAVLCIVVLVAVGVSGGFDEPVTFDNTSALSGQGGSGRVQLTSTGSLTSQMPNAACTPRWSSSARASSSLVVPGPRFVSASVCLVDNETRSLP
jgi:hypothetical protein